MEREILFRGKRIDNGEWIEGYYYSECGLYYIFENRQAESMLNRNHPYAVIPETIGQFTGLKDKNGKKIFEGDRYCVAKNRVYIVRYCNKEEHNYELIAASFVLDDGGDLTFPFDDYACEHGEVIGNAHDKNELPK
jgi:uncharacterized phage protein (TIGR01671 family)